MNAGRPVYIVDGRRTPILKMKGPPGPFTASDLAVACSRDLLLRYPHIWHCLDETVWGCVMPSEREANIARLIGERLGLGHQVPAHTVQRNCASGLQALDAAAQRIAHGAAELVLAGGTEAMSHAPVLYQRTYVQWLAHLRQSKNLWQQALALRHFRPHMLRPVFALKRGLTDPISRMGMGHTAEELGARFDISRAAMDAFALESHELATRAQEAGIFADEITPLFDAQGQAYPRDTGVRPDTSIDQLKKLPPVFDQDFGKVTAGNSAQISDGAAVLLLASEQALERYQLPVLGVLRNVYWAALDPVVMGLGPVLAMRKLFEQEQVEVADIDCFEINEAFAAQVLACLKAWTDEAYLRATLGCGALAAIDRERLNPHGGAIAVGHPIGMSGARIVLHVLKQLQHMRGRYGVASLCVGGGQGGAALVEHPS